MAGSIINQNGSSSITVTNLIEILEAERVGFSALTLTNMSTTSVSAIAAGSHIEVAGSIYRFSTEEPISTSNVASTVVMTYYIELVPSSSEITAQFSSVSPAWRSDYAGWYNSTSSNYRTVARNYFDGTNYPSSDKYYYQQESPYFDESIYVENDVYCGNDSIVGNDLTASGNVLSNGYFLSSLGREPADWLHDSSITENDLYNLLLPYIPNNGDIRIVSGALYRGTKMIIASNMQNSAASTSIVIYGMNMISTAVDYAAILDASTDTWAVSLTW